jgi:hypothetical protein
MQSRTKKTLGDFRHKYNLSVTELVKTFKESQERYINYYYYFIKLKFNYLLTLIIY